MHAPIGDAEISTMSPLRGWTVHGELEHVGRHGDTRSTCIELSYAMLIMYIIISKHTITHT